MVSETYLKEPVKDLITKMYGHYDLLLEEFPITGTRSADLVFVYDTEPYIVAVELKISDWKSALKQALCNKPFARYSYVAIQWKKKRKIDKKLFEKFGIGLIAVNGYAEIIVKPKESKIFDLYKNELLSFVKQEVKL